MLFQVTRTPTPGSVLRVRTRNPLVEYHYGVAAWPDRLTGAARVIHGIKGDVFRVTSLAYFEDGLPYEEFWIPQSREQASYVIERMESFLGKPWDLFTQNCEHGAFYALTGEATSPQLTRAVQTVLIIGGLIFLGHQLST